MAWGLYQCFFNLAGPNTSADEPIYVEAGWNYLHGDSTMNQEHPPFAKYLMGVSQLLFGQGVLAGRIAAATAVFAGGIVLYFWLRREAGWIAAIAAAGFWLVLPHGVQTNVRLDRLALLEPFMVLFAIAAFAAAWQFLRGRSWLWLALSGAAMAFSVTSKVSSAVLIPALLLIIALPCTMRLGTVRRSVKEVLLGLLLFGGVLGAVAVVVYFPVGLFDSIDYMLRFQSQHDVEGHLITVAGTAYYFPPWWSNLWFSVEGMGVAPVVVLLAGGVASVFSPLVDRTRWALIAVLATAIGCLWLFYLVISDVALGHYYYAWVWLFCVAAGLGVDVLLRPRANQSGSWPRAIQFARVAGVLLLALAVACGAYASTVIAQQRASGMALVLPELEQEGIDAGDVYVAGMAEWEYVYQLDGRQTLDLNDPEIVAFALKDQVRFPLDPALTALLEARASELDRYTIDDVTLYLVRAAED